MHQVCTDPPQRLWEEIFLSGRFCIVGFEDNAKAQRHQIKADRRRRTFNFEGTASSFLMAARRQLAIKFEGQRAEPWTPAV